MEKENKRYILFFDIDGTIITEGSGILPDSIPEVLARARENGHLLFINTGRTWAEMEHSILSLGFDGFVCGCGTYIRYGEKLLFWKNLGHELSKRVAADLEKWNVDAVLEGAAHLYYRRGYEFTFIEEIQKVFAPIDGGRIYYNDDEEIDFDKITAWVNPGSSFSLFRDKYRDTFEFIDRGTGLFEIIPSGYSKASGIGYLLDYFRLPLENAIALGDSANDISMLQYVNKSVAMGSGDSALFGLADYVTTGILEDGVRNALKHYGVI